MAVEAGQAVRVVAGDENPRRRDTADHATRLERARRLLQRVGDQAIVTLPASAHGRSEGYAGGEVLPVPEPLARLFPAGGLRRGGTVAVSPGPAATSLLLSLLAEVSASGAWVGVVNRPDLGLVAAAEAGVRLERLALVPRVSASDLIAVVSALLDGLDVVAWAGVERAGLRASDRRRLVARAWQRGSVLIPLGAWPGADVELRCVSARWYGVGSGADGGSGRLVTRDVQVRTQGRGIAPGGRETRLRLPAPGGGVDQAPLVAFTEPSVGDDAGVGAREASG